MDYLRRTMDSEALAVVLDLPPALRNKMIDIIVLPAGDMAQRKKKASSSACGKNSPWTA
jgi:hypothetical protein